MNSRNLNPFQKEIIDGISILTAVKNRSENLGRVLQTWVQHDEVDEIIIVDWSSDKSIKPIIDTYQNGKIFLFEATNQPYWHISIVMNLAFRLSSRTSIVRVDADVEIFPEFFERHKIEEGSYYAGFWNKARNINEASLSGFLFMRRDDFFTVNGYNEYIKTYGYDDIDLNERLEDSGLQRRLVDYDYIYHIPHENRTTHSTGALKISDEARSKLYNQKNRHLVQKLKWSNQQEMLTFRIETVDGHLAKAIQYGEDKNIVSEQIDKAVTESALRDLLHWDKPYSINMNRNDVEQLSVEQMLELYKSWNAEIFQKIESETTSKNYKLLIVLENETRITRIIEILTCLATNLNHPNIDKIHVFYDSSHDLKNRNYIKRYLDIHRIKYIEINGRPTFEQLFEYANATFPGKDVIIANSDEYFNESLKLLNEVDFSDKFLRVFRNFKGIKTSESFNQHIENTYPSGKHSFNHLPGQKLAPKPGEIHFHQKELEKKNAELSSVYNSYSWKIGHKLTRVIVFLFGWIPGLNKIFK